MPPGFRRGTALVWVALLSFILIGLMGLSLDWGKVVFNAGQLQNAADAAALAGAQSVKYSRIKARADANAIASMNTADGTPVTLDENSTNDPNGEIVLGRWVNGQFHATPYAPNAVKVVARRHGQRDDAKAFRLIFGPAFGMSSAKADANAIALSQGSTGGGLLLLGDTSTDLRMDGTAGRIDLSGVDAVTGEPIIGDIQVNSGAANAVRVDGHPTIIAGEINVHGSTIPGPTSSVWQNQSIPISVNIGADVAPDPLAGLDPPNIATMPRGTDSTGKIYGVNDTITRTVTLNPGYFAGGIDVKNGTVTLRPGVYAFGGGKNGGSGLVVKNATVTGTGVLVYITGDPTGTKTGVRTAYGMISLDTNADVQLVSRGDVSPSDGIGVNDETGVVLWQDRNDGNPVSLGQGNDGSSLKGTLYFPRADVEMRGNPVRGTCQLIARTLWVRGNINLNIAYDGRNVVKRNKAVLVQ